MPHYPHMCRDDHVEIGHADSESEMCPLCVANAKLAEADRVVMLWAGYDANRADPFTSASTDARSLEDAQTATSRYLMQRGE